MDLAKIYDWGPSISNANDNRFFSWTLVTLSQYIECALYITV